ncbi:MAG: hypothetical protein R2817_00730 [Flavobacteriales bacterium]
MNGTHALRAAGLLLCCALCWRLAAQGTAMPTTGTAIMDVGNRRDIHHHRNQEAREKLKRKAVQDAVERVAAVDISVVTELRVREERNGGYRSFSESYLNQVLEQYHVSWSRAGDFTFQRDPSSPRAWLCSVSGTVRQLPNTDAAPLRKARAPEEPQVLAKRGPHLYVAPGRQQQLQAWQRYAVVRTTHAASRVPGQRTAGRIVVLADEVDGRARAQVISGRYAIREGQHLVPASFPLVRGGVGYGNFQQGTPGSAEEPPAEQVQGHALDYFEESLLDGVGLLVGMDFLQVYAGDSLTYRSLAPRLGATYRLPLLPEVLHLRGTGSFGMNVPYPEQNEESQFMLLGKVDLCLNLGPVELSTGFRYNQVFNYALLSGAFTSIGIAVDLYRYIPGTHHRRYPGLRDMLGKY